MVKVLDFGLVRAVHSRSTDKTTWNAVVGTPHFMSPEAIERPAEADPRSDLYSVGAVGYWLLSGKTLFDCDSVQELLQQQVKLIPPRVSERLGSVISADLENLIMSCLSKVADQRPASALALDLLLSKCQSADAWSSDDAQKWWKANVNSLDLAPVTKMAEKTLVIAERP